MQQSTLSEFSSTDNDPVDNHACPTCGDTFHTLHAAKSHHNTHDGSYWGAFIADRFDMTPEEFITHRHHERLMTIQEIADELDASLSAINSLIDRHGIETRSLGEAKKVEWDSLDEEGRRARLDAAHEKTRELAENGEHQWSDWAADASDEERAQRTKAAREAHREKYGDEGYIGKWVHENREKHHAIAQKYASRGTPARSENGMAGVTGQDHHGWRGGKSIYDAVKKQLRPSFDSVKGDYRGDTCEMCGCDTEENGRPLDVHHIVPILCGGTNDEWNAMSMCRSCHRKAESFTRRLLDPVLTE